MKCVTEGMHCSVIPLLARWELAPCRSCHCAVEEKRQSLVANVVVIERQFADAHLLQQCGSHLVSSSPMLLLTIACKEYLVSRIMHSDDATANSHQIAQCRTREIQSSTWSQKET